MIIIIKNCKNQGNHLLAEILFSSLSVRNHCSVFGCVLSQGCGLFLNYFLVMFQSHTHHQLQANKSDHLLSSEQICTLTSKKLS